MHTSPSCASSNRRPPGEPCFQSSSALKKDLLTPANEQRMTICVELLGLLFNDDDGIPEMIFMSGLINSAVQLLDSNKL